MTPPTETLIAMAKKGDRSAGEALVARYSDGVEERVKRRVRQFRLESVEVADLVQETFLGVLKALQQLEWRGEPSFVGWLMRIADNVCAGVARRGKHTRYLELGDPVDPDAVSAYRALRRRERLERLRRAIDALPERYREPVRLARLQGLKIAEVAARTGSTEGAVKQQIVRGLRKLRDLFGDTQSFVLPDSPSSSGGER